jgi:hypothetical protein
MPGSLFEINCRGCGAVHPISTGESTCWDHGERWVYEQWYCPECKLLKSRPSAYCCREEELTCETCGSALVRWSGQVWFEHRTPDGVVSGERVDGPCPRCGYLMSSRDPAPDGTIAMGLWD